MLRFGLVVLVLLGVGIRVFCDVDIFSTPTGMNGGSAAIMAVRGLMEAAFMPEAAPTHLEAFYSLSWYCCASWFIELCLCSGEQWSEQCAWC